LWSEGRPQRAERRTKRRAGRRSRPTPDPQHQAPLRRTLRVGASRVRRIVMLARIFIDRPVLACVLSVVILLLGGISAGLLPVAEYPQVTPPMVRVSAVYPGANAQVVADTIAAPIE